MLISKWPDLYSDVLAWECTSEHRPIHLLWVGEAMWGLLHGQSDLRKNNWRYGFEWVSLRRCTRNYLSAKHLLCPDLLLSRDL